MGSALETTLAAPASIGRQIRSRIRQQLIMLVFMLLWTVSLADCIVLIKKYSQLSDEFCYKGACIYLIQFCTFRFSILSKCFSLFVTRVRLLERAVDAIKISESFIIVPFLLSPALIFPNCLLAVTP